MTFDTINNEFFPLGYIAINGNKSEEAYDKALSIFEDRVAK